MLEKNKDSRCASVDAQLQEIFQRQWDLPFLFLDCPKLTLTYGEFFTFVYHTAATLRAKGVDAGKLIAVCHENKAELIVLYFAVLFLGAAICPLDPLKGNEEIEFCLNAVKPDLVIVEHTGKNLAYPSLPLKEVIVLSSLQSKNFSLCSLDTLALWSMHDYEQLFLITFTSGSTAFPKGVKHSFANLFRSALAFGRRFNINDTSRFYHNLPMSYMAGILNQVILPFAYGASIVVGERFSVELARNFWDLPVAYGVNTLWLIPTIANLALKFDRDLKGQRYCQSRPILACIGTAPLSSSLRRGFKEHFHVTLFESYGLTETLFVASNDPVSSDESTVGRPLDGVNVVFNDDDEIMIKTPWSFLGYLDMPTAKFEEYYKSGDLGCLDDQGRLSIIGRKKDIIIRGGLNISPQKIENLITKNFLFEECAVVGIKDSLLGEKTVCFYIPNRELNRERLTLEKEVATSVINQLGKSYRVDQFVQITEMPKTNTGKVDKRKLASTCVEEKL